MTGLRHLVQVKHAILEPFCQLVGRQCFANQPTLNVIAAHRRKQLALRLGLDTFGDEFEFQRLSKADHRLNDRLIVARG